MARWEYKTVKFAAEGWFLGGKVDDKSLEDALNRLASQGWSLITIITSSQGHGQTRDIVAVLKRVRAVPGAAPDPAAWFVSQGSSTPNAAGQVSSVVRP
jgi:hypothetical protein